MYQADTQIRVRYAETDQMSYVYYGNYAMYFEVGRVEAMRQIGFSYRKMEEEGVMMPVLESHFRYIKPGKYDEKLTIRTKIPSMPGVKIRFEYEVLNEQGELITEGWTVLAFFEKRESSTYQTPKEFIRFIETLLLSKVQLWSKSESSK